MTKPRNQASGGGALFLFCAAAAAAGTAFDFNLESAGFWIGAQPGGAAALGAGAAVFAVAAGHVARALLGRPARQSQDKGSGRDAGVDA